MKMWKNLIHEGKSTVSHEASRRQNAHSRQILGSSRKRLNDLRKRRCKKHNANLVKDSLINDSEKENILSKSYKTSSDDLPSEFYLVSNESEKRKDCYHPCPICHQCFGNKETVLLSCSHLFHSTCLKSFESFIQAGRARKCPLCRKLNYRKFQYSNQSRHAHAVMSCLKIQSIFRMILSRRKLEKELPDFHSSKFGIRILTKRIKSTVIELKEMRANRDEKVQKLLNEIETSLSFSKKVFKQQSINPESWQLIKERALNRENDNCSICLEKLKHLSLTLLPCSHLFHENCLKSFKMFMKENYCCPLCRERNISESMVIMLKKI